MEIPSPLVLHGVELILLLAYFATSASLLPLWELSGDDAIHFEFARSMVQTGQLPFLGPPNSFGFSEDAWGNWIQAGFYALHPSFVAIQLGTIGLQTPTHW